MLTKGQPPQASTQLIYDQFVVVCVTNDRLLKSPGKIIPVGPSHRLSNGQRKDKAFIDSDFKEKVTHLALAMNVSG